MSAFPSNGARRHPREYTCWRNMRNRCCNPRSKDYRNYGARGICVEWNSFAEFLADLGPCPPGLTLDRLDNDGNYSAANCRWATKREQDNNRRTNVRLTHCGTTKTITQWARDCGISPEIISQRLKSGRSVREALAAVGTIPIGRPAARLRYDLDGRRISVEQMATHLAFNYSTFYRKLANVYA